MTRIINEINDYLKRLFPINRSITGDGNRKTLSILQEIAPIQIKEYPSGTSVYDWVIPDEWNVNEAWIKDSKGEKVVDFSKNNIHLVSYSSPLHEKMSFEKLKYNLHYLENLPDAVPYRTSYYKKNWGFCVNQSQYKILSNIKDHIEVKIDSKFNPQGSMTIGELIIPGEIEQEILISTYLCHPSVANDNLSGTLMTAFLARELLNTKKLNRSYRIIWVPETIGAIAYCAMNENDMKRIKTGLVVSTVGGPGKYGYKQSSNQDSSVNAVIEEVFKEGNIDYHKYPFDIHGSDERQYSTQGFRINTASITKDKYYEYPYYHTSLDNLDYIDAKFIYSSLNIHHKVLEKLNSEPVYKNNYPNCEVMLSKHELYPSFGGAQMPNKNNYTDLDIVLWLLWLCDGDTGIYEIKHKLGIDTSSLNNTIRLLENKKIINRVC